MRRMIGLARAVLGWLAARPLASMAAAFAAAAVLAAATLALAGAGAHGTDDALQVTARFSFLLFLPAYAGGALATLCGPRLRPLARQGRAFGLAFAAAHVVHLGLVGWLCWIGATPGRGVFVLFGSAAVCVYLLLLFSLPPLQRALGRQAWRLLRIGAMNYIAYAFAVDFLGGRFAAGPKYLVGYLPFAVLSLAAPACYAAAALLAAARGLRRTRTGAPVGPVVAHEGRHV
jgi:hypothetical protein